MAYLGNAPKQNLNTMNSQQFSGDGSTVNFTLSQSVSNTAEAEMQEASSKRTFPGASGEACKGHEVTDRGVQSQMGHLLTFGVQAIG